MIIPHINIKDYSYHLPKSRIAEFPLHDRAESKLLIAERISNNISQRAFRDISGILSSTHHLVFNKTKVINARIFAKKSTGGAVEFLLLNPISPSIDPQISLNANSKTIWKCMIGGRNLSTGSVLRSLDDRVDITILRKDRNIAECLFEWSSQDMFIDLLDKIGKIPLPPYIEREIIASDNQSYQTVYAKDPGSVAAPTAGLHFTTDVLDSLSKRGVRSTKITLHVGAGTFQPVKSELIAEHKMHQEMIHVHRSAISDLLTSIREGRRIVAVGTTSIRTMESIAVFGELLAANPDITKFDVPQWSSYNIGTLPREISLHNVLNWMDRNQIDTIFGGTELIIVPGYTYRVIDHIITNFHQPESTLILLVVAFLGKDLWKKTYDFALDNEFRFLSYGDSSLLL